MKKTIKVICIIMAASMCLLLLVHAPYAKADDTDKVYTLTMTMHDSLASVNGVWYQEWADKILEATDGHVQINIKDSEMLCKGSDVVDYVGSGAADIGWVFTGFYSEQFPLAQIASIPLTGLEDSVQGTRALWDLYEEEAALQEELSGFKILFLYNNPVNFISTTKREIKSMEDLKGLMLRCPTGAIFNFVSLVGASPVQMSSSEIFNNLSKNVIDGAVFEWSGIGTWSLSDSLKYYMDLPLFCGTFMTVVNWDSWNKLPAEYQEIIESVSLRDGSIDVAEAFRQDAQASCEAALEKGGQLTEVSEEFKAELTEAAEGIVEQWISDHSTDSFDASSYYDHFIEYLEQEAD